MTHPLSFVDFQEINSCKSDIKIQIFWKNNTRKKKEKNKI